MNRNVKDESPSALGKTTFVKQGSDVNGDGDDGNGLQRMTTWKMTFFSAIPT
jgi:hypothetical protein